MFAAMNEAGDAQAKTTSHSADDHRYGQMSGHQHAPWEEADHDHDADFVMLEAGSKELEHIALTSIGMDIGSSGTQVVFSRLLMRGPGEPAAMRRHAKSRETLYTSPVVMTPYAAGDAIDIERLRGTLARAFQAAGLTPDDIDTGAVIMTGAAAQQTNAPAITAMLAQAAGDVVAAAAGDHMEAALAAHGSGAVERSRALMGRVLNIDIGGATTKLAIADCGRIVATAAMRIGGRQMALDRQGRITRLHEWAREHARRCGLDWQMGAAPSRAEMEAVAQAMAALTCAGAQGRPEAADLFVTDAFDAPAQLEGVMFSGGVAEYVHGHETRDFGDCGRMLGRAIATQITQGLWPWPVLEATSRIRATVLGASEHTVQLSGATSFVSAPAKLLPRRNLPVLQPFFDFRGDVDAQALAHAIKNHRRNFGDDDPGRECALAFRWRGAPEYLRLRDFAEGIAGGLADRIAAGTNLYILIENDAALSLGAIVKQELAITSEVLVFDSIALRDFDYVDLGRIRLPSGMAPVTIKSLLFGGGQG